MKDLEFVQSFVAGEPPIALLTNVQGWLTAAQPLTRKRVELFHRRTVRVRVAITGQDQPIAAVGSEEGVAIRLRDGDGHREGFAAAACGPGGVPLSWLVTAAGESSNPAVVPWRDEAVRLVEAEDDPSLPTIPMLIDWLATARQGIIDAHGITAVASAWVEAALTVESLVNDGGLTASRSRQRVWATATFRDRGFPDAPERPHLVAARHLNRLHSKPWASAYDGGRDRVRASSRASDRPIALEPEAAAALVAALVPAIHGATSAEVDAVGSGWVISDEPFHADALVGGEFDDAGFAARRIELAGDSKVVGRIEGPGCLRRASYRDRPDALPSLLVVAGRDDKAPDDAWQIRAARVHPSESGPWIVELDGFDSQTAAIVRGATLIATPERLVAACVGSFGMPRQAGWGVITPGLILAGLRVEG